ncbi:hypothetical protein RND71_003044 [Anisodus tanguticus]|uniref:DUF569 domain-containing protein n=1 Tax=Anisodus tanguticus TaxID=243964 RepID=A0AAE1VNA0_9SOLA|nr:hypothetical protein RND71_003044 [Anisodus tanguticus]
MRGNGGVLPWKNIVAHDIPYQTATKDNVHVVEILADSSLPNRPSPLGLPSDLCAFESRSSYAISSESSSFSRHEILKFSTLLGM